MQCPFCTANIPAGSELCPHCMSDLRNAGPHGDRGTATDSGKTGYVPPRQGYVPPTRPWGNEPEPPAGLQPTLHAAEDVRLAAGPVPPTAAPPPEPPAAPYPAAPPYAPAPQPARQPAPVPQPARQFAPVPLPPAASPAKAPAPAQPWETVRHQPDGRAGPGRRQTALDADQAVPRAEGVRGRTRLDKEDAAPAGTAISQRRVVGWMVSFDVNLEGQEYVIREGKNTLGRARDADISVFYDDRISATHATIVYRNGQCSLRDEMTNNGTYLNGQDIGPGGTVSLKSGDVLRVGRCTFKLYLLDPAEVSRLWPHLAPPA